MRKTRHQCPAFAKLKFQFDIAKLQKDFKRLDKAKSWGGLSEEYHNLCDLHDKLPSYFLKKSERPQRKKPVTLNWPSVNGMTVLT